MLSLRQAYLLPKIESALGLLNARGSMKGADAMIKGDLMDFACMLNSPICLAEIENMKKEIRTVSYRLYN